MALNKSSSESTTSSNSSSGCSSMSANVTAQHSLASIANKKTPPSAASSGQRVAVQPAAHIQVTKAQARHSHSESAAESSLRQHRQSVQALDAGKQQRQRCDAAATSATPAQPSRASQPVPVSIYEQKRRLSSQADLRDKLGAQKALSQPLGGNGTSGVLTSQQQRHPKAATNTVSASPPDQPRRQSIFSTSPKRHQQEPTRTQHQQQQPQARRASVAVAQQQHQQQQQQSRPGNWRKQSVAFINQNSIQYQRYSQEHSFYFQDPRLRMMQRQQQQQLVQPQTVITASSVTSMDCPNYQGQSRRESQCYPVQAAGTTLIPIPPDQIHLRRLSDQSNLVRRSSIIADTIEGIALARNRSQSNIDTVNYFQPQSVSQNYGYSDENLQQHPIRQTYSQQPTSNQRLNLTGQSQHRRLSDQWGEHRQYQPQQMITDQRQQQQMSSIITSYAQKSRRSSEELHSDSSSDIDDEPKANDHFQVNYNQMQGFDYDYMNHPADMMTLQGAPMSIPSVSVSEFNSSQQRLHQLQQQQQQHPFDPITTSPMQINVAIEQVIQQQRQQQNELSPRGQQQIPRRGSSGRLLPKIPGEQSRSLLDLPLRNSSQTNLTQGQPQSMLDLPCVSPTIRRASAPEGQNIKIVVDDIDGSIRASGNSPLGKNGPLSGKQGEIYERLVLYRDDSLDPNTSSGRGFGLHVVGGKIGGPDSGQLHARVAWVLPGGPADKVGLRLGDEIIEWDGKCLLDMTYEQVADTIEASANIAELLVKPAYKLEPRPAGVSYVRSQRRLSQQTERDIRKYHLTNGQQFEPLASADQQQPQRNGLLLNSSGDLLNHQRRSSGQFQPSMFSDATSGTQQSRSGTGRKLPQIPGVVSDGLIGTPNVILNAKLALSAGQLDHSGQSQPDNSAFSGNMSQLNAYHDQQSRSANELCNGNQTGYQHSQLYMPLPMIDRNGVSLSAIDSSVPFEMQPRLGPNGSQYNHLAARDEICGLVGLQVSVDERLAQLEISVLSAINIDRNPSLDYYVRVRILPESNRFKPCTTQPCSDMNWKETFIFQNFPTQQIHRMALEIGVWENDEASRLSTRVAQPICETMITIQSACERNTDFWPLRPPPTSPQARRKSLNDLLEFHSDANRYTKGEIRLSAGYQQTTMQNQWNFDHGQSGLSNSARGSQTTVNRELGRQNSNALFRERSSSNRNLPDTSKLQAQPRRASDEVAGSSSHRLMTRISPAASRRSISVMNVVDGQTIFNRPNSRLGSQSNILKAQLRRDSQQQVMQPGIVGNPASRTTSVSDQSQGVGVTPTGRRSSLVGIQSMAGYRSQKSSQSDTTDHESPKTAVSSRRMSRAGMAARSNPVSEVKHRAQNHSVGASPTQTGATNSGHCSSGGASRRSSTERTPQLQRRGSLAMMTLRKFKRTMSLTKTNEPDQGTGGSGSRRSSSSSEGSHLDLADQDLGVRHSSSRAGVQAVGKIKLSLIMSKGQFEVEVICAEGLQIDVENSLGVYVKTYLKGKSKSNKRKTRAVQATDSPVFKQLIRYDGSLVDNKTLEVSVWLKQGGLKGKLPIGYTDITLGDLNLAVLRTSWYNLRSMVSLNSSSIED